MTLLQRLEAVRNRLVDRGDYDQHGADVVDATTIGEAIAELRKPSFEREPPHCATCECECGGGK